MGRSKYGNRKVSFRGEMIDSARERDRYIFLLAAQSRGEISGLRRQVPFEVIPAVKKIRTVALRTTTRTEEYTAQQATVYKADFVYVKNGVMVVEDVKISRDVIPPEYRLKEKLMYWRYDIKIRRIYQATEAI